MKGNVRRVISAATLLTSLIAIFLVLKKPQPVAQPQPVAAAAANAQSFQDKLQQLDRAKQPAAGAIPLAAGSSSAPVSSTDVALTTGQPEIKDYQVNFDGDIARGQFLTQVAGKDVWVTLAGHLGSNDGYATFVPTEFKVGDLNVPVSLVNDALQKRLAEQRDRLKLPDNVSGIKVENGELVMTQK